MLFTWPREGGDWGDDLDDARACIAQAVAAIGAGQPVLLLANDAESEASIKNRPALRALGSRLQVLRIANNDIWIRDYGPISVIADDHIRSLDFRFNGWAGKFEAGHDDRVCEKLLDAGVLTKNGYQRREYFLEGGAIDSNGRGELLVTRCCLLGHARNAEDSQARWDQRFEQEFGAQAVHWLEHGYLHGDDTDGHVDTLARFVAEDAIVYQSCTDPNDEQHQSLSRLGEQLASLRQPNGKPYRLFALPLPQPQLDPQDGRRLPAGYANFLIANKVIVLPQYGDPGDAPAREMLARCFPEREIVGIDCRPLIRQNGAIHCAAMQLPDFCLTS